MGTSPDNVAEMAIGYRAVCVVLPLGLQGAADLLGLRSILDARIDLCFVTEDEPSSSVLNRLGCESFTVSDSAHEVEQSLMRSLTSPDPTIQLKRFAETMSVRLSSLSVEEMRVLEGICLGRLNKQMAKAQNVSVRTIEQRRRRVFAKMGVDSAAPLAAQLAMTQTIYQFHRGAEKHTHSAHLEHFFDVVSETTRS